MIDNNRTFQNIFISDPYIFIGLYWLLGREMSRPEEKKIVKELLSGFDLITML